MDPAYSFGMLDEQYGQWTAPDDAGNDDLFADIIWPEEANEFDDVSSVTNNGDWANDDWTNDERLLDLETFGEPMLMGPQPVLESSQATTETSPHSSTGTTSTSESQGNLRFSKEVKSILRVWFNEHKDNPYPTAEEKEDLAKRTGLKRNQISLWLANQRRRARARKATTKSEFSALMEKPKNLLTPYERWKILPLQEEATAAPMIRAAVAAASPPVDEGPVPRPAYPKSQFGTELSTTNDSQFDAFFAQSLASYETGVTSMVHGTSVTDTTFSSAARSQGARERRRRRHHVNSAASTKSGDKDRPFQCTFCFAAAFTTKYDWQRHEKSQHLSLEKWVCCLSEGMVATKDGIACAFCGEQNPDKEHLELHHYSACQGKEIEECSFYRKDHFQQHLRLTHESKYHSRMEAWKIDQTNISSRCGFCNAQFSTWSARADHLAAHFKCHLNMKDWIGDLGLEPSVDAVVERSVWHQLVMAEDQQPPGEFVVPGLPRSLNAAPSKIQPQQAPWLPYDAGPNIALFDWELESNWSTGGMERNLF